MQGRPLLSLLVALLLKASSSSFSNCLYFSSFKFLTHRWYNQGLFSKIRTIFFDFQKRIGGLSPRKVNVGKFNFSSIEDWKCSTLLQTNSFKRDLPRILIKFLITFYNFWELLERTYFTEITLWLLVKSEQRQTRNINKK